MKRILVSLLLVFSLLLGSICSVNAATIEMDTFLDLCVGLERPIDVPVYIQGKLTNGAYSNYVSGRVGSGTVFHSVLDMINVKDVVSTVVNEADRVLDDTDFSAFKNIPVEGSFTVTASWTGVSGPTYTLNESLPGFTFDGSATSSIFDTAKITGVTGNSVTATINVKDNVTVNDLTNLPNEIILEQSGFSITSDGQMDGVITGTTTIRSGGVDGYPNDVNITFNFIDPSNIANPNSILPVIIRVESGGTGGGGTVTMPDLTYESNGGTSFKTESYAKGKIVELNKVPVREGYVFDGWYVDAALTEEVTSIKMTEDITVYAKWVKERPPVPEMLNGEEHFAYVIGYPDGTVRPNANITRAEVTTIFFRLLKDSVRDGNLTEDNVFDDVNDGDWYNAAISTMAKLGIVNGRLANEFVPNAFITRAEFTTICARFENLDNEITNIFTDIDGHWAEDDILESAAYGWIEGYEDGTFRPDEFITRAEAMTLINRVLNRVHKNHTSLLDGMVIWSDNMDIKEWYYTAVQEATNSNDYEHINSVYKKWTRLLENRDWSTYED